MWSVMFVVVIRGEEADGPICICRTITKWLVLLRPAL